MDDLMEAAKQAERDIKLRGDGGKQGVKPRRVAKTLSTMLLTRLTLSTCLRRRARIRSRFRLLRYMASVQESH